MRKVQLEITTFRSRTIQSKMGGTMANIQLGVWSLTVHHWRPFIRTHLIPAHSTI